MDLELEDHNYSKKLSIQSSSDTEIATVSSVTESAKKPVSDSIVANDADSFLYTGLSFFVFHTLVLCLQPFAPHSVSMPIIDQILMTLIKLKLNLVMADLGRRFGVSQGLSSKIVGLWIDVMAEHCKSLVPWLPRETIRATLPQAFRGRFQNTTCIIDCSESVLQKAKNLDSRSASYSHYYASNTVKYLIAVAPCGLMFISDAYGGRCSDKYIHYTGLWLS